VPLTCGETPGHRGVGRKPRGIRKRVRVKPHRPLLSSLSLSLRRSMADIKLFQDKEGFPLKFFIAKDISDDIREKVSSIIEVCVTHPSGPYGAPPPVSFSAS
jgi:hypothetical protein